MVEIKVMLSYGTQRDMANRSAVDKDLACLEGKVRVPWVGAGLESGAHPSGPLCHVAPHPHARVPKGHARKLPTKGLEFDMVYLMYAHNAPMWGV